MAELLTTHLKNNHLCKASQDIKVGKWLVKFRTRSGPFFVCLLLFILNLKQLVTILQLSVGLKRALFPFKIQWGGSMNNTSDFSKLETYRQMIFEVYVKVIHQKTFYGMQAKRLSLAVGNSSIHFSAHILTELANTCAQSCH